MSRPHVPSNPGNPMADRGAQAERTRLAWSRTSLVAAAHGGLLLHAGFAADVGVVGFVPAVLALCCAALFKLCGAHRYRTIYGALGEGRSVVEPGVLRLTGWTAAALGLTALGALAGGLLTR